MFGGTIEAPDITVYVLSFMSVFCLCTCCRLGGCLQVLGTVQEHEEEPDKKSAPGSTEPPRVKQDLVTPRQQCACCFCGALMPLYYGWMFLKTTFKFASFFRNPIRWVDRVVSRAPNSFALSRPSTVRRLSIHPPRTQRTSAPLSPLTPGCASHGSALQWIVIWQLVITPIIIYAQLPVYTACYDAAQEMMCANSLAGFNNAEVQDDHS